MAYLKSNITITECHLSLANLAMLDYYMSINLLSFCMKFDI